METQKIVETTNYTYLIQYQPTRLNKGGVWQVKRISVNSPNNIMLANIKNNPNKTIDNALTDYETLTYNYLSDLE